MIANTLKNLNWIFDLMFSLELNYLIHFCQTCHSIFPWTFTIWIARALLVLNPLLHIWQTCCLKSMCTISICLFRSPFREKLLTQKLHLWGLSFSWIAFMWLLRTFDWLKLLLQMWHLKFFCFSWTVAICLFNLYLLLNILLQNSHCVDFCNLATVNSSSSNGFFVSLLVLIWVFFLWKYFVWIFKLGKFRNFLEHFRHLWSFCLFNEHRPFKIINQCLRDWFNIVLRR